MPAGGYVSSATAFREDSTLMNTTKRNTVVLGIVLLAGVGAGAAPGPQTLSLGFDSTAELTKVRCTGKVGIDARRAREGGGALRIEPGARVIVPLRKTDGTGKVVVWVYDEGSAPADPKKHAAGPMWGLVQTDGSALGVGPIYAPYLSGAATYAAASFNPAKNQRPWQKVQYLAVRRKPGWRQWTFDFTPDKGLRLLVEGKDVNASRPRFNWDQSRLDGFAAVAFWGDASGAGQVLWVDSLQVELGPPANRKTRWPPPPTPPPGDWKAPLAPMAPWNETPYAQWKYGPAHTPDYFPLAVWLQEPNLADRYKQAGFNLYVGLWKGPTPEQLDRLRRAGMPVICYQNAVGLEHRNDKIIVGWMHGDEPDNAHRFDQYWKRDKAKIREAWPEIFNRLRLDVKEYRGYGPAVPPKWIVRDYRHLRRNDPDRPVMLNLGQGVAWKAYIGRGERRGHLEDYPEYIRGCDIVSFDIYPAAHRDLRIRNALWYVARGVDRLRTWSQDRKVVWNVLECTTIGVPGAKPTPEQVRAEVWMSLIHGSRGLIYFVHQFKPKFNAHALLDDPAMLAAVTRLNHRIHSLAPVLNSPTLPARAVVESSNPKTPVHVMVKQHDGALYLFAVAMYEEPTTAVFRLPGLPRETVAEVLDEGRTVSVRNGAFRDAFPGNGVHLYRIRPPATRSR